MYQYKVLRGPYKGDIGQAISEIGGLTILEFGSGIREVYRCTGIRKVEGEALTGARNLFRRGPHTKRVCDCGNKYIENTKRKYPNICPQCAYKKGDRKNVQRGEDGYRVCPLSNAKLLDMYATPLSIAEMVVALGKQDIHVSTKILCRWLHDAGYTPRTASETTKLRRERLTKLVG